MFIHLVFFPGAAYLPPHVPLLPSAVVLGLYQQDDVGCQKRCWWQ